MLEKGWEVLGDYCAYRSLHKDSKIIFNPVHVCVKKEYEVI